MTLDQMVELMWRSTQQRADYPEELRGKLSFDDAYRIQFGLIERYSRASDQQTGWKVGLTSKAMQAQLGISQPVFGFLLQSGHKLTGTVFDHASLTRPGFENELCLTVGTTLTGPAVTLEQARRAISHVAPALEIIERRGGVHTDLGLALADNGQQKAFVTGVPMSLGTVDLAKVRLELSVNGVVQERALGEEVLGTPIASIAWLANKLAEFGRRLEAGARLR